MSSDTAIVVEDLGKRYHIGVAQKRPATAAEAVRRALLSPFRYLETYVKRLRTRNQEPGTNEPDIIWALKNVSFEVKQGEVLGIIGRNGAGKSTLLKILSRLTDPTEGHATIRGRVNSLLEVGTGFSPDLTGRENIYLNAALHGMKRREIMGRLDEIIAFSEVEKFIDTPVRFYSSGMYTRLAFAVAAHLEPEVLIVDEVLAVGDAAFQKKCLGKMGEVAKGGRTVLFVSHSMAAVQFLCQRGMVMQHGGVRYLGNQTEAIGEYLRSMVGATVSLRERTDRGGTGEVRIVGIEFRDANGHPIDTVVCGQDVALCLHFETQAGFKRQDVSAGFAIATEVDVPVFLQHNRLTHSEFGPLPARGTFVCRLPRLPLPPANYRVDVSIIASGQYLDSMSNAATMTVMDGDFFGSGEVPPISHGVCLVDGKWSVEDLGQ